MFGADTAFSNDAPARAPLASHPAFAWIMIGWCALLFGLATYVISAAFSSSAMLPILLGFVAALVGGACGYQFARSVGAKTPKFTRAKPDYSEAPQAASIMSTEELGSASLDAPLEDETETTVFEMDAGFDEADNAVEQPAAYFEDPFAEDGLDGAPSPNDRHAGPALGRPQFTSGDLAFGALEDRPDDANLATEGLDGEPADADEDALSLDAFELAEEQEIEPEPPRNILEAQDEAEVIALKDRELAELSMPEMVERFAVGLENHRTARAVDPASRTMRPSDPRIAQAIRELPIGDLGKPASNGESDSATRAQAEQTEAALREALEKLQRMSDHS